MFRSVSDVSRVELNIPFVNVYKIVPYNCTNKKQSLLTIFYDDTLIVVFQMFLKTPVSEKNIGLYPYSLLG